MKYVIALSLFFALNAHADCREESLVRFFSHGREVESQLIGYQDKCDNFGGNLVYTPEAGIYFYVNFNIPGDVDLDAIDEAFAAGGSRPALRRVSLAVVDEAFIKRMYGDPRDAVLNLGGDTLFISEKVLAESRLGPLLRAFYSSGR